MIFTQYSNWPMNVVNVNKATYNCIITERSSLNHDNLAEKNLVQEYIIHPVSSTHCCCCNDILLLESQYNFAVSKQLPAETFIGKQKQLFGWAVFTRRICPVPYHEREKRQKKKRLLYSTFCLWVSCVATRTVVGEVATDLHWQTRSRIVWRREKGKMWMKCRQNEDLGI